MTRSVNKRRAVSLVTGLSRAGHETSLSSRRPCALMSRTDVSPGQLPQIGYDIGAVLRLVKAEEHLGARHELRRVGEPAVERIGRPDDARILQRRRIGV